jgi:two-component system, OmpR family, sensor kinase
VLFDDRLETVLNWNAQSCPRLETEYRQLIDLLGSGTVRAGKPVVSAAYGRLMELSSQLSLDQRDGLLRQPELRLRSRPLIEWLARSDPPLAVAAAAVARLSGQEWLNVLPQLPTDARLLLGMRHDLPPEVRAIIVGNWESFSAPPASARQAGSGPALPASGDVDIAETPSDREATGVRTSGGQIGAGRPAGAIRRPHEGYDFAMDFDGEIRWADSEAAPFLVGLKLSSSRWGAMVRIDPKGARAMTRRLPLNAARLTLAGAREMAGEWRLDAMPVFRQSSGAFEGYVGRIRRAVAPPPPAVSPGAERMREIMHELRAPVNGIQGFAEVVQQQVLGPAPHAYRSTAAAIAVEAAKLLAGFDEIDRLARLEGQPPEPVLGHCDWREAITSTVARLNTVTRRRSASLVFSSSGEFFTVASNDADVVQLTWRVLATLAGALAPGEVSDVVLQEERKHILLKAELPGGLLFELPLGSPATGAPQVPLASIFGPAFSLRLAKAEAVAAGGALERTEDEMIIRLPRAIDSGRLSA